MAAAEPPGPDGLPLIGSTATFLREPFASRRKWATEYGDIVSIEIFGETMYMIADPELIKRVLVTDCQNFTKHQQFEALFRDGLVAADGELWKRQRSVLQPVFFRDQLVGYTEHMTDVTEATLSEWSDGESIDVSEEMHSLTLEILLRSIFGSDFDAAKYGLHEAVEAIHDKFRFFQYLLVPDWAPTPTNRRYERGIEQLDAAVQTLVQERRQERGSNEDLLGRLIDAETEDSEGMSDEIIQDQVLNFILAGHETSALALTFTLHLLAHHQDWYEAAREEVEAVTDGERLAYEHLTELDVVERVVTESLRLYPPAHSTERTARTDIELGGYRIPEGASLFLPQWVVHRDERWYDDPDSFDPDRWADDLDSQNPEFAYYPFGGGPRQCIGRQFALVELQLVVGTIVRNVDVRPLTRRELTPSASLTLHTKESVRLRVLDPD